MNVLQIMFRKKYAGPYRCYFVQLKPKKKGDEGEEQQSKFKKVHKSTEIFKSDQWKKHQEYLTSAEGIN